LIGVIRKWSNHFSAWTEEEELSTMASVLFIELNAMLGYSLAVAN
jgi:hypothetical protein